VSGKAKPFRLTDEQRDRAAANAGLAFAQAARLCRSVPWLDRDDALSMAGEALCRAVAAHETKGAGYRLGTFVDRQTMGLLQHARTYRAAACRGVTPVTPTARSRRTRPWPGGSCAASP
jgi:hypothetical protein